MPRPALTRRSVEKMEGSLLRLSQSLQAQADVFRRMAEDSSTKSNSLPGRLSASERDG